MATVKESINAGLCLLQDILGTNVNNGCVALMRAAKSVWLIAPGAEFRAGEEFQSEKDRLIKASQLIILDGVNTFEENGSEDAVETLADDTQAVTNEGKYKFTASWAGKGFFFNRALHSYKGFRNWNVILVDGAGILGSKTATGGLTGFTTGMIQPAKLQFGTNAAIQKEGLMFQFLERSELDSDYAYIADSSLRKERGVTEVVLSYVNTPADTDTTVTIKATLAQDSSAVVEGLDFEDFRFRVGGTASNPTAGDDTATAGTYPLTVAALTAGGEVDIKLFKDGSSVIVGPDGGYYKSNTAEATVSA